MENINKERLERFKQAELQERKYMNLLADHLIAKYEPTDITTFESYDGFLTINDKKYIIECKIRNEIYDTYVLEQGKYDRLLELSKEMNLDILYINVTFNGTYIWNVTKMIENNQLVFKNWQSVKTTMGNQEKKNKPSVFLSILNAKLHPIKLKREITNLKNTMETLRNKFLK